MASSIVVHWRRLTGSIHPDDVDYFKTQPHSFNLTYPPPAFIGDVENAPVILLEANGGFDPIVTPQEFLDPESESGISTCYIGRVQSTLVAPYYARRNYASLIKEGRLALVNAVAYRSPAISNEGGNRRLAQMLPSTHAHRRWLHMELLDQAAKGDRLVVAHRNRLWELTRNERKPGVVFTTNPRSPDLSLETLRLIDTWLETPQAL